MDSVKFADKLLHSLPEQFRELIESRDQELAARHAEQVKVAGAEIERLKKIIEYDRNELRKALHGEDWGFGKTPQELLFEVAKLREQTTKCAETGPCRKHPKMFWVEGRGTSANRRASAFGSHPEPGYCTICQEVMAAEAAIIEEAADEAYTVVGLGYNREQAANAIRDMLITPARTAALDKRLECEIQMARWDEALKWFNNNDMGWCQRRLNELDPAHGRQPLGKLRADTLENRIDEARDKEREDICRWLEGDKTWPDGKIAADSLRTMANEHKALRTADTQGKVEADARRPEYMQTAPCEVVKCNLQRGHKGMHSNQDGYQPKPEAVCPRCKGIRKVNALPDQGWGYRTIDCPDCRGTGKAGKEAL